MMSPLFSIITVTYNAADTIGVTMKSVARQTCCDYEHIVMDGKSSDDTIAIARGLASPHTRIVSQKDNGIYDAMNKGIEMSNGKYLIFMNAGDTFHAANTLELMANAITETNEPGIVYGQTVIVEGVERKVIGKRHLTAPRELSVQSFADGMVVCHQAMAVSANIAGQYDLKYRYSADYEWVIRCLQHSSHNTYVDDTIVDYLSEGTTTKHLTESLYERFRIMCHYYGTFSSIIRHIKFIARGAYRIIIRQSTQ